jgi:hypothetical protein
VLSGSNGRRRVDGRCGRRLESLFLHGHSGLAVTGRSNCLTWSLVLLLSRLDMRMHRSPDIKDAAIWRAQIEHRRAPLPIGTLGTHRLARLSHGGVYWGAICNSRVEGVGESADHLVRALKLHSHDRRHPLLYEALSRAGERVGTGSMRSFTGMQDGEAERTVVV